MIYENLKLNLFVELLSDYGHLLLVQHLQAFFGCQRL